MQQSKSLLIASIRAKQARRKHLYSSTWLSHIIRQLGFPSDPRSDRDVIDQRLSIDWLRPPRNWERVPRWMTSSTSVAFSERRRGTQRGPTS